MEETKMGMFKVKARVANPADPKRFFEEDFWVDTGAIHSIVPEDRLEAIGVKPLRTREFTLADGQRARRHEGEALFTLPQFKETWTCLVTLGSKGSACILGSTTMAAFCVEPDPGAGKLIRIPAILAVHLISKEIGWKEHNVKELHGEIYQN